MRTRTHRLSLWRRAAVAACLAAAIGLTSAAGAARAAPVYPLYYALEIPPVLTGYEMDEQKDKHLIYTSLLRGTLGGLAIETATLTLRPGASANAGGGEFSLRTAAGTVKSGLVLMTTDGRQTTLLFLGTYLGARLEFRMAGPATDFGSTTLATKGLALTNFAAHSEYLAAVTQAVANLAPAPRAQAITQADGNLRLVAAFQGTSSP